MVKLGEINTKIKPPKKRLFLCTPTKKTIAVLSEAYDVSYLTKINALNELVFKIPVSLEKDGAFFRNPNVLNIRNRYIFKLRIGGQLEYFMFNDTDKVYGGDTYVEYRAFSLGVQLADKNVRYFKTEKDDLRSITEKILSGTGVSNWKLGYVDSEFVTGDDTDRFYETTSQSVLEVLNDIAEKWNAIIVWNTVEQTINYYMPSNVGLNKGFKLKEGKYLNDFNLNINTTETVTRLKVFGKDSLTFEEISDTAQNYLEDFSFYMHPFKRVNNQVVEHSHYFTDELCIAIEDYQEKQQKIIPKIKDVIAAISTQSATVADAERRLAEITESRVIAENERDVLNAKPVLEFAPQSEVDRWNNLHSEAIRKLRLREEQEEKQKIHLENQKKALNSLLDKQEALRNEAALENNFSKKLLSEIEPFIIEKEYSNDSIDDVQALYEHGKEVFTKFKTPKFTLQMSIIDFLDVMECQNDWDKLGLGDTVHVQHKELLVDVTAKITEINYNFENQTIDLTIANEQDNGADAAITDLINKADNATTVIGFNKFDWGLSKKNNGMINDIINNKWDSLKQAVLAGYEQQIEISERGIIVRSLEDANSWLVIQNGFLAITNDAGNTWKHAISKDGIWGEYIWGKIISGVNLRIEDESGIWITQGSLTRIFRRNPTNPEELIEYMRIGQVSPNCYGIESEAYNTRVSVTSCDGIAIRKKEDGDWKKVFWTDLEGTVYAEGMVTKNLKIVNDLDEVILDAENNYLNLGILDEIALDGTLTSLEKMTVINQLYTIYADYDKTINHAIERSISRADDVIDLNKGWSGDEGFTVTKSTKNQLEKEIEDLHHAYSNLITYMSRYVKVVNTGIRLSSPLFIDQTDALTEQTSKIDDRELFMKMFREYTKASQALKAAIENLMYTSGINLGEYYNNLMMSKHGFIAVRNDGMYRAYLNATHGLALQRWENGAWVSKLYATLGHPDWEDGTLYAEGLVTKNLRIVDGDLGDAITFDHEEGITIFGKNGEIIRLNANEAISITVDGDKKFWVGTDGRLYAKDITTHNLKIVNGELGEKIIFDENDGITINGNDGEQIRLNANEGIAIDQNGDRRIWLGKDGFMYAKKLYIMGDDDEMIEDIDGSYISDLTVNKLKTINKGDNTQDIVHIERNFIRLNTWYGSSERTKMEISFEGTGDSSYPVMQLGAGVTGSSFGSGSEIGKIYKDNKKLAIEYDSPSSGITKLYFNETDSDGQGQSIYMFTKGGIRLAAAKKIVLKGTTDSEGNLPKEQYIRLVSNEDVSMRYGDAALVIKPDELLLQFNGSNSIRIAADGVTVKGTKINLN